MLRIELRLAAHKTTVLTIIRHELKELYTQYTSIINISNSTSMKTKRFELEQKL